MYRFKYHKHFKKLHECSDLVVLLSDSFKQDLSFFIGDLSHKVCSMPNPISAKIYESESNDKKEKKKQIFQAYCDRNLSLLLLFPD